MGERRARQSEPAPESLLPLNAVEFRILLVLLRGPSHPYRIVKEIEAQDLGVPGVTIYPANLYRHIRDLVEKGWIEEVPLKAREANGRRRTELRATPLGRRVARAEARRLEALVMDAREVRLLGHAS